MMPQSKHDGPTRRTQRSGRTGRPGAARPMLPATLLTGLLAGMLATAFSGAAPARSAVPFAVRHELDLGEALLRHDLARLPAGSGIVIERVPGRLTVRVPARMVFVPDTADLKPEQSATVPFEVAAQVLRTQRRLVARIDVYSDALGSAAENQALTQQRAFAVEGVFDAAGIAATRLVADGRGAERPLAGNDTPEGRIENRRVEIVIARAGGSPAAAGDPVRPAPAASP